MYQLYQSLQPRSLSDLPSVELTHTEEVVARDRRSDPSEGIIVRNLLRNIQTELGETPRLARAGGGSCLTPSMSRAIHNVNKGVATLSSLTAVIGMSGVFINYAEYDPDSAALEQDEIKQSLYAFAYTAWIGVGITVLSLCIMRIFNSRLFVPESQNTHHVKNISVFAKYFLALKATVDNQQLEIAESHSVAEHLINVFDELISCSPNFKAEMLFTWLSGTTENGRNNPMTLQSDDQKIAEIKKKITDSVNTMLENDAPPLDYPRNFKTSDVLKYMWTFIEHLEVDMEAQELGQGDSFKSTLIVNLMKHLYAANGYCSNRLASEVMTGFSEGLRYLNLDFGLSNVESSERLSATDFNEHQPRYFKRLLVGLLIEHAIKDRLLQIKSNSPSKDQYKEQATRFIKERFLSRVEASFPSDYPQVWRGNPAFLNQVNELWPDEFFAYFIDQSIQDALEDSGHLASSSEFGANSVYSFTQ